jgi:non-ribosomal peptide synthetase component F
VESSAFPQIIHGKFPLFHEDLSQIKTKFENIWRHSSGAYEVLIREKNRDQKISQSLYMQVFFADGAGKTSG